MTSSGWSWQPVLESMSRLQQEMESLAPDRPLDRAEGSRYLARLLASALASFTGRSGPTIDYATPRIGGFNPDYVFGNAALDPRGTYRIRGRLNDVDRLAFGTYPGRLGQFQPIGYLTKDGLHCDPDGCFEVRVADLAPEPEPSRPAPSWLPKSPATTSLMVRQLVLRAGDQPADLLLERIDSHAAARRAALTGEQQAEAMKAVELFVAGAAGQFFRWTRRFSQLSNTIAHVPAELEAEVQADPDTFYAIGYFELADDERLEVRFTPPACDYWGLHTTNHWLEPIEHPSLVTHLNNATAKADRDGSVTLSISPTASSQQNAIDTLDHGNGAIFFRVIGADEGAASLPSCEVRPRR